MNWHGLRGEPYDCDTSGDSYLQISELVHGVDSLYKTDLYADPFQWLYPDTVQISDMGTSSVSTEIVRHSEPRRIKFAESGQTKMTVTDAGYVYLKGTAGSGTPTGLLFGSGVGLSTDGNLVWGDTLLTHQEAYFDSTGSLDDGLVFRNSCGEVVHLITATDDSVLVRGWDVEGFPEF
jgi:hypothetical protein